MVNAPFPILVLKLGTLPSLILEILLPSHFLSPD